MRQKALDGCAGHLVGRWCVVKERVLFNAGDRGFLRADRIVLEPDGLAYVVTRFLGTVIDG